MRPHNSKLKPCSDSNLTEQIVFSFKEWFKSNKELGTLNPGQWRTCRKLQKHKPSRTSIKQIVFTWQPWTMATERRGMRKRRLGTKRVAISIDRFITCSLPITIRQENLMISKFYHGYGTIFAD